MAEVTLSQHNCNQDGSCGVSSAHRTLMLTCPLSNHKGEKIKRQGYEKGQSKDKYVKCSVADKVLDWDLAYPGTTPNTPSAVRSKLLHSYKKR